MDRPSRRASAAALALVLLAGLRGRSGRKRPPRPPWPSAASRSRSRSAATDGASTTSTRRTRTTCSSPRATRRPGTGCSSSRSGGARRPARWRRSLGRRELKRDLGARLHMFHGDLDAELQHYHPRGKPIVESFVRGINAYIAETRAHAGACCRWSSGCSASRPAGGPRRWSISRHQALRQHHRRSAAYAAARRSSATPRSCATCSVLPGRRAGVHAGPGDRRQDRSRTTCSTCTTRSASRCSSGPRSRRRVPRRRATAAQVGQPSTERHARDSGDLDGTSATARRHRRSNNWVVSGARTQSTYPMLANDPHRARARRRCATGCTWWRRMERHRRRRAGAARRLDRPQRVRRLGPHDLRHRQRGSLRLRHQSRQPEPVPVPRRAGKTCA